VGVGGNTGVADQDVELVPPGEDRGGRGVDRRLIGDVELQRHGSAAQLGSGLGPFQVAVGDGHACALPGEGDCDAAADPLTRAGYQRGLAGQVRQRGSSLRLSGRSPKAPGGYPAAGSASASNGRHAGGCSGAAVDGLDRHGSPVDGPGHGPHAFSNAKGGLVVRGADRRGVRSGELRSSRMV
jgi:hypothetical protein